LAYRKASLRFGLVVYYCPSSVPSLVIESALCLARITPAQNGAYIFLGLLAVDQLSNSAYLDRNYRVSLPNNLLELLIEALADQEYFSENKENKMRPAHASD